MATPAEEASKELVRLIAEGVSKGEDAATIRAALAAHLEATNHEGNRA